MNVVSDRSGDGDKMLAAHGRYLGGCGTDGAISKLDHPPIPATGQRAQAPAPGIRYHVHNASYFSLTVKLVYGQENNEPADQWALPDTHRWPVGGGVSSQPNQGRESNGRNSEGARPAGPTAVPWVSRLQREIADA